MAIEPPGWFLLAVQVIKGTNSLDTKYFHCRPGAATLPTQTKADSNGKELPEPVRTDASRGSEKRPVPRVTMLCRV